jgi:hypothetical protein
LPLGITAGAFRWLEENVTLKIASIAKLIKTAREQMGTRCVVMLGAGASLSSGVKLTKDIAERLLADYGQDLVEGTLWDRFDRLWARSDQNRRDMFLRPYLELKPAIGYSHLARLIEKGFFDVVITFNFDQLLETALREIDFTDFDVVVRGEYHNDQDVRKAINMPHPRVKILKMHGSLSGGDTFLFTREEMHKYPDEINRLLLELTQRDILMCGYAFQDMCVIRAFSDEGGSIYCVNPSGAPLYLQPIMGKRHSTDWEINGDSGRFDTFFSELYQELTSPARSNLAVVPKMNPFKFLVSYDVRDKDWFLGRKTEAKEVMEKLEGPSPRMMYMVGPSKAGKTSFVRAGLIANLPSDRFLPIYMRCRGALEAWLPSLLGKIAPPPEGQKDGDVRTAIQRLAASTTKHILIVLDQFERVVYHYQDTEVEQKQLLKSLKDLRECAGENVSFLCVGVDEKNYWRAIAKAKVDVVDFQPFPPRRVGAVIRLLAKWAGIRFSREVIAEIMKRYQDTLSTNRPFTLAHAQAVCNILAGSSEVDLASFQRVMGEDGDALDVALNVHDVLSFVEDIPDEMGRNLLRKVMRVIPRESKRVLAEYVKEHFSELFAPPESLDGGGSAWRMKKAMRDG